MANFLLADKRTAKHEGGYQCIREDNGNWTGGKINVGKLVGTNWGISAPLLGSYLKKVPTVQDMKNLSKETAQEIRRKFFWQPLFADQIENEEAAFHLYDMAINAGVTAAIKLACESVGIDPVSKMNDELIAKINGK